jgi:hypothetical protein
VLFNFRGEQSVIVKDGRIHKINFFIIASILIYVLKIGPDVLSVQESIGHDNRIQNELVISKDAVPLPLVFSGDLSKSKLQKAECKNITPSFRYSLSVSCNFPVFHFFNTPETIPTQTVRIISVLRKQNICHQSSEDDLAA